ncbi:MAG TPA: ferritin-like domain-containing protein [Bryobacteraceae bacterium]|nr:ferritin-like domain-containing protein [Bryobacteraceae bacterium]
MKTGKFEAVLSTELADLHEAETQIVKALPKMIAAASSEELAQAFQDHLDQTKEQVRRLESIFESMGEQPGSGRSEGIGGLVQETERIITELEKTAALDAALIGAAQKVEHYEIAGYRTARAIAEVLGQQETAELLQETLDEEIAADEALETLAEKVLTGSSSGGDASITSSGARG